MEVLVKSLCKEDLNLPKLLGAALDTAAWPPVEGNRRISTQEAWKKPLPSALPCIQSVVFLKSQFDHLTPVLFWFLRGCRLLSGERAQNLNKNYMSFIFQVEEGEREGEGEEEKREVLSLEGRILKLKLQYFGHQRFEELTHLKRPWCWERLRAGGEGDDRGWDGWMASPNQWTWVWVNSRSWWWAGRPGVLRFMSSQRVGQTERLNWTDKASHGLVPHLHQLTHTNLSSSSTLGSLLLRPFAHSLLSPWDASLFSTSPDPCYLILSQFPNLTSFLPQSSKLGLLPLQQELRVPDPFLRLHLSQLQRHKII